MNGERRASQTRPRRRHRDRGFTLVELLVAVVLSSVIAGVTVAVLITALNVADTTTDAVRDSTDSGLVSAFLYRDAQSAGAIDPETADPLLGVSTTDMDGCIQPGASPVVRFSWFDRTSDAAPSKVVVTYALVTDALDVHVGELTRRICKDGSSDGVDVLVGSSVSSATATCEPGPLCAGHPRSVTLVLTGAGTGTPDTILTASLRGDDTQDVPDSTNSSPVALLAMGAAPAPCPNVTLSGTGAITVLGDAIVDDSCAGPSPAITGDATTLQPTGTTSTSAGLTDPFRDHAPPSATCDPLGTNPDPLGISPGENSVIVYHQAVSINAALPSFQAGRYVFCEGLSIGAGGEVDGEGILFYVAGGQLAVDAGATVDLTASTVGDDANLLIWVASPETIVLHGGPHVSSYRGFIYAPSATLELWSEMAANIGGIIVEDVTVQGAGQVRIGLPVPELSIAVSPDPIPAGQVDVVYTSTTLSASGGTSPYTWRATGLPAGLAIDPTSGAINGTPTASGSFDVVVTTFDATASAASIDYTITVAPKLLITGPGTLPAGQVGVAYTPTTITSSGGTSPYTWSATGLPDGLTIDSLSGQISGIPGTAGTFPDVVVTVTDATMTTATAPYTITIGLALTVTGTIPLPDGQVGTAYATPMTASGGTPRTGGPPDYFWSATGLPADLAIDPDTGVISGTPTAAGTFDVVVTVTDAIGAVADTGVLVLTIAPPAISLSVADPATLPVGEQGSVYPSTIVTATGGVPPYTWTATGLPAGVTIDLNTGAISGTPSAAGTFNVVVTVTDTETTTAQRPYTLTVVPPGCLAPAAGWRGEYFGNTTLTGLPTRCRDDATVNFNWGTAAPITGVPADNFSVRWTRTQDFVAGDYRFTMGSDTGARLYIDGSLVFDQWPAHAYPSTPPSVIHALTAGSHTIVMEYYETTGVARATLSMYACTGAAAGWSGEYFSNSTLTGTPGACRDDATVNFNWGTAAPITGVPADNFSVRWSRTQDFVAGNYRFAMGSDAGARLYIDGAVVLDNWAPAHTYASTPPSVIRALTAGSHTIVMEYYETTGAARATLSWRACATAVGWSGEYFSNATLTGTPTECRDDASVNFNWGTAAPITGVPADNFSVRWTRTQNFAAGNYTFTMGSDAGARLYVDGNPVLDNWAPAHTYQTALTLPTIAVPLTAGNHTIVMEHYETTGVARATLSWYECAGTSTGWRGEYFSNTTLTGTPTRCRQDASVNFNWGTAAPITGVPADNFSVRWTRTQNFTAGNYRFTMGSDAGARLYVDGNPVLDTWTPAHTYPATPPNVVIPLTAGNHTIVMEYYETTLNARATLAFVAV